MPAKEKKRKISHGKQDQDLTTAPLGPITNRGEKRKLSKLPKPAAAGSSGQAPPFSNGSVKEEKKSKRKSTSSQPDKGSPQLPAPVDYKNIGRAGWRVELGREQVVKVSTVRNLSDGLDLRILRGNHDHGKRSLGDKDKVWVNLLSAQIRIHSLADTLYGHLARNPPLESLYPIVRLGGSNWARSLIETMESASRSVLGADGDAMVKDLKTAVARVCAVNEEYDAYGDRHLGTLIDVYAHCMGIVSSLWQELCDFVDGKFLRGWPNPPRFGWEDDFFEYKEEHLTMEGEEEKDDDEEADEEEEGEEDV